MGENGRIATTRSGIPTAVAPAFETEETDELSALSDRIIVQFI
jgi:hypothetical protein